MKRIEPLPGQESVWDYPRPPRLEPCNKLIEVRFGGELIASSRDTYRVLETSHPPVYYIPRDDVAMEFLAPTQHRTFCEFKGHANYFDLRVGTRVAHRAAWTYDHPVPAFEKIRGYLSFYASRVDACFVDREQVEAQAGDFYGGWITSDIVGPFKGGTGTWGW